MTAAGQTSTFEPYMDYTFEWNGPAQESVTVSSSFDNWVTINHLSPVKRPDGSVAYEWRKRLPARNYQYKYVVDGEWQVDPEKPVATDAAGNKNNVIYGTFIVGATVARELHQKTFLYTQQASGNADPASKQLFFLKFTRYSGQCEHGYPWHGEWELSEAKPENVIQRGKWSVSLHRPQRVLQFEPALSCGGVSSASYESSAMRITANGEQQQQLTFTRFIS